MSHVTLVRHGQANSSARDEVSYDKLSDLGHCQARWLGEHLRGTGERFARAYCGTLRRHRETADAMALGLDLVIDPRLDELEYFTMAQICEAQYGIDMPNGREEFALHMRRMFGLWRDNAIDGAPVPFATFEARVSEVLTEIAGGEGRAVVVTSGGVIGMAMRVTMELGLGAFANACLAIENSSMHRFQPMSTGLVLTQFNAVPHLEDAERALSRTHL
ncbi:histidine phosphatase family protein [Citreicella sp. C3M06]|uniref:histidine phosphatase family protein n=1 Tax=Roseobacteraceae TaxID=2854170 RepID=UPI001C09BA27|nr:MULTISPECIES: histidine phosphatase family protein [Roseobacteraceae]MBU2963265.1 histidine phosphatase family protein [Citreicella sp. C3M06]MDO6585602.1 histidine phosphatase family protein [Salipiger sp. 1_MG-2023]